MADDEQLRAQIAHLQGRIDRHRQQTSFATNSYAGVHKFYPQRATRYGGGYRARARGGRFAPTSYRNRTLVINNGGAAVPSPPAEAQVDIEAAAEPAFQAEQWVSVQGGHNKQLINASVYEKVSQQKIKDMQGSLAAKQKARDDREKARLQRHFSDAAAAAAGEPNAAAHDASGPGAIQVNGIAFRVIDGGSKLIRVSGTPILALDPNGAYRTDDPNSIRLVPRQTKVAGVTFVRSKHGNLYRSGLVKSKKPKPAKSHRLCPAFTSTGTCPKGPNCRFTHDPHRVAICKDFLQKGACAAGDYCDLSHEPTPHRVPACIHFLRGNCTNDGCRYAHVKVSANAPVCRAFAQLGYCDRGSSCDERHVTECPDYANKGFCHTSHCRLPHVDRAGQLRKAAAANRERSASEEDADVDGGGGDDHDHDTSDVSSDEETYSDDIDSDDDIVIQGVEGAGHEVSQNQDFIHI